MPRKISIGIQDFKQLIENDYYYIDKTSFIKEWWEEAYRRCKSHERLHEQSSPFHLQLF
ncbi:MAG: hypothetical protein E7294_14265 [Lachnospiraceae bacterium]|nr:hypothetical protein [Lachnospiraceae bacterium]